MNQSPHRDLSRMQKRDVGEVLLHRFLNEYGYNHGPVIAKAIVQDILETIQAFYPDRLPPKTINWLAVRIARKGQRKGLDARDLVAVRLVVITEEEMILLTNKKLRAARQARETFNRQRLVRWCFEAYEQGGVLMILDMAILTGLSERTVRRLIHSYEEKHDRVVPVRGTVHDLGPTVTHKVEVVRRWLRHESPADIAKSLNYSQESVDRYLDDFQRVRLLVQHFPLLDIPALANISASVVGQYVALLREYEPTLPFYQQEKTSRKTTNHDEKEAPLSTK